MTKAHRPGYMATNVLEEMLEGYITKQTRDGHYKGELKWLLGYAALVVYNASEEKDKVKDECKNEY